MAPELDGQPNFATVTGYTTPSDGDLVYNINWSPGKSLGWIYYGGNWYEFGLTNTADINIELYNSNTIIGIGTAPNNAYRVNVNGNVRIDGDLSVTGRGAVASSKYISTQTTGDGVTLTYPITTYTGGIKHTQNSVLVFINGVAQIPGINYTVDANGANVVFSAGDAPSSIDTVRILELPI